jgi:hypothetical protein
MSESAELEPWQQRALNTFKGRGTVQITGRQLGKSVAQAAYKRLFDDIYARPVEDLILSEGTVYGSRYYCVEPIGGSWFDMEVWSTRTFGPCGDRDKIWGEVKTPLPNERWYMNNRKFWFRSEKDRNWFIVRWSK